MFFEMPTVKTKLEKTSKCIFMVEFWILEKVDIEAIWSYYYSSDQTKLFFML